ncbi:MAG: Bor family protein [Gemmatimonadaceae bacterium]
MFTRHATPFRRIAQLAMALVILPTAACYHQVIDTGKPASPTVIDKPWQMSFIYGLVPPPELNVAQQCPGGVAKVETQHSFLNGLVAGLTFGILTPMQVTVTCAATGRAAVDTNAPKIGAGSTSTERAQALEQAIEQSNESGKAVLLQF